MLLLGADICRVRASSYLNAQYVAQEKTVNAS